MSDREICRAMEFGRHVLQFCDCLVLKDWENYAVIQRPSELENALRNLIQAHGGIIWIRAHPRILLDEPPVCHAASYRTYDLLRYRQVFAMQFEGTQLFIRPEDARELLRD